jgi:hypothetical protein
VDRAAEALVLLWGLHMLSVRIEFMRCDVVSTTGPYFYLFNMSKKDEP